MQWRGMQTAHETNDDRNDDRDDHHGADGEPGQGALPWKRKGGRRGSFRTDCMHHGSGKARGRENAVVIGSQGAVEVGIGDWRVGLIRTHGVRASFGF